MITRLRRHRVCGLVLGLLPGLATATATAAEPVGPVVVPADAPRQRDGTLPMLAPAPASIFVNFDGATLQSGWDDAELDRTQIEEMVGTFSPYGADKARRAAILQALHEDWAAYDVDVTDQRPGHGAYTMVMVGPTNPFGPATLGMAPLDCGDSQTSKNVAFAFYHADDGRSPVMAATTIGHEVAHTFGLEHVDEPNAVMHPFNVGGDPWFHDECLPIVGEVVCGTQHASSCGVAGEQSSHDELLGFFGPSAPDSTPPHVGIMAPADGEIVEEGETLELEVEADDAHGIDEVRLLADGRLVGVDEGRPFGWRVTLPETGAYIFVVEALDRSGNLARSQEVVVTVANDPGDTLADGGRVVDGLPEGDDEDTEDDEAWRQDEAGVTVGCSTAPMRPVVGAWMLGLFAAMTASARRVRRRPEHRSTARASS